MTENGTGAIRFGVLGALRLSAGDREFTLRGPKLRKVFALLAVRADELVSLDDLVAELWAGDPPGSAVMTARTHVYHLRKWFASLPVEEALRPRLAGRPHGYLLEAPAGGVDAGLFRAAHQRGARLLAEGRVEEAARALRGALALWRGPVLSDVPPGPVLEPLAAGLTALREQALEARLEADLRRGRHREIVDELRALVARHPFDEWRHARLISALHGSGRRAEALAAYEELRVLLRRELGMEPSQEVLLLRDRLLSGAEPAPGSPARP
ncbi:AfsR/SARP family transcriptional regulator [Streptomyces roseofulvus]|uniref:AfsR/SARP family transcriptional regulator n=2 Tax=Streptomyces TaxID=1883 RepID=A0ABU4K3C4_9ACTN|nr:AfsR/SARP family transcriptional regulator [Streptomyces roseolus]MDX2291947.1 AfsR/SARP family transcriptional regulator [Streptomyces roseolus]